VRAHLGEEKRRSPRPGRRSVVVAGLPLCGHAVMVAVENSSVL
jgi:hypothetical protein